MTDPVLVYITTRDEAEARVIGRQLVDERLAACVNILAPMSSIYRWQGAIEEAREAVLIAKTTPDLVEAVAQRVRVLHSSSLPCILVLPVVGGDPAYLAWLRAEAGPR